MLYRLASMSWMNLINGVRTPCEQARVEAGDDPELQTGIHQDLAWVAFYLGDLDEALAGSSSGRRLGRDARRRRSRAPTPSRPSRSSSSSGAMPARPRSSEAVALQEVAMSTGSWTEGSVYTPPGLMLGLELMWMGRLDEARDVLEARARPVRAARDVHRAAGGPLLPGGARMPRRPVGARRALRRREHGHRPGVRPGRDAEPCRPLQPGLAAGAARTDRRGEGAWRRPACGSPRRTTTGSTRPGITRCSGSSTCRWPISRAPDGTSSRRWRWLDRLHAAEPGDHPVRAGSRRGARRPRADRRGGAAPRAVSRSRPRRSTGSGRRRPPLRCRALIAAAAGDLDAAQRSAEASVELLERRAAAVRDRAIA